MNFIHAFMHLIMLQEWTQKFSQDKCFAQVSPMLSIHVMFANTSKSNLCVLLSDHDPLLRNGQVQVLLSDNDLLLRNGQVQVLLSDNDPLRGIGQVHVLLSDNDPLLVNGQIKIASRSSIWDWSSFSYIKALSFGMGIDSLYRFETLPMGLVIDSFTSRPSAKQWSLISWLHRDPLRGNGYRSLYIKTLSFGMVIDSFCRILTLFIELVITFL